MKTKMHAQSTVVVTDELKVGPEPHGIRFCLVCCKPIAESESWYKIRRGGGACAVGVHVYCRKAAR